MKLVSTKLSAKEAKKDYGPLQTDKPDLPKYPYGLKINLDAEMIEKLGLDADKYTVGTTCKIECVGEVVGYERRERQESTREQMDIQIIQIGIDPDKAAKRAAARDKHLDSMSAPKDDEY